MLESMGLQRVGHDLVTEQQRQPLKISEVRQSGHHGQGYREREQFEEERGQTL